MPKLAFLRAKHTSLSQYLVMIREVDGNRFARFLNNTVFYRFAGGHCEV